MNLLAEGAYVGRIEDLISGDEYLHFINQSKIARDLIQEKRNLLMCRYDYDNRKDGDDHSVPIDKVEERDQYIKDNNFGVQQKWYYLNNGELPNREFRNLSALITKKHYPDFPFDLSDKFWGNATFTLYENGSFINDHKDGLNPDRLCVVLIYFSDPDSYSGDSGGELVIRTAHDEIKKIKPILGNYCVLDFSQNNLYHNVNMVKGDFKRYTYVHFVESWDFIESLHSQKQKLEIIENKEKDLMEKIRSTQCENYDLINNIEDIKKKYKEDISLLIKENIELKETLAKKDTKKKLI